MPLRAQNPAGDIGRANTNQQNSTDPHRWCLGSGRQVAEAGELRLEQQLHRDHVEGFGGGGAEAHGFIIRGRSGLVDKPRLITEEGFNRGVVECGVDVVGGVQQHKVIASFENLE